MTQPTSDSGYAGRMDPSDTTSLANAVAFVVEQMLGRTRTCVPVKVMKVYSRGEVAGPVLVDVKPLINMIDGDAQSTEHDVVHGLPFFRLQGGGNVVICDPQVDDLGLAVISDRDASAFKKNKGVSNPGSFRRFDLADGFYLGGFLNAAPTQWVRFKQKTSGDDAGQPDGLEAQDVYSNSIVTGSTGMTLTDTNGNTIVMNSDGIELNGVKIDRSQNVSGAKDLTTSGDARLGGGGQFVKLADGSNATKVKAT